MAMRKTHLPEQIIDILRSVEKEANQGKTVAEACRALGISEWSFYRWRKKYGGMEKSDAKQLKELEKENARLKKLLAEKELDNDILKEALKQSSTAQHPPGRCQPRPAGVGHRRKAGLSGAWPAEKYAAV